MSVGWHRVRASELSPASPAGVRTHAASAPPRRNSVGCPAWRPAWWAGSSGGGALLLSAAVSWSALSVALSRTARISPSLWPGPSPLAALLPRLLRRDLRGVSAQQGLSLPERSPAGVRALIRPRRRLSSCPPPPRAVSCLFVVWGSGAGAETGASRSRLGTRSLRWGLPGLAASVCCVLAGACAATGMVTLGSRGFCRGEGGVARPCLGAAPWEDAASPAEGRLRRPRGAGGGSHEPPLSPPSPAGWAGTRLCLGLSWGLSETVWASAFKCCARCLGSILPGTARIRNESAAPICSEIPSSSSE